MVRAAMCEVIRFFHLLQRLLLILVQRFGYSGGIRVAVDRKLLRKIKAKKVAQGHKADDHEPEMQL